MHLQLAEIRQLAPLGPGEFDDGARYNPIRERLIKAGPLQHPYFNRVSPVVADTVALATATVTPFANIEFPLTICRVEARLLTEEQLREALAHTRDLDAETRLLVHCHAGKSRSPAMAIGILVQAGLSPAAALEHVRSVRPELIPNRLMIRQLDRLLGQGGELVRVVDAHYQSLGPEALLPNRGGLNL